jgi:putative ABC transport system permease protein
MILSLVVSNLRHRPVRTVISAVGISLGIVLMLINVGLVHGSQNSRGSRESNVKAELMFWREFNLTSTSALGLPIQYGPKLNEIPGVAETTPVGQYLKPSDFGIGFEFVEGIEYDSYARLSGISMEEGKPLTGEYDVIIDREFAKTRKVKIGGSIDIFNRPFTISGIYGPEAGTARFKIRLDTMQKLLVAEDRCTFFYIKCVTPDAQEKVAEGINTNLPGNTVVFVRDLPAIHQKGLPALQTFLKLVVTLAVLVSVVFVFLTMYTTIAERKREIGILKSLGASKTWIVRVIQTEALVICAAGVIFGYIAAFAVNFGIITFTSLRPIIEPRWMVISALISLASALGGALYPAWRAASIDPVESLSYE